MQETFKFLNRLVLFGAQQRDSLCPGIYTRLVILNASMKICKLNNELKVQWANIGNESSNGVNLYATPFFIFLFILSVEYFLFSANYARQRLICDEYCYEKLATVAYIKHLYIIDQLLVS